jgi:hypothetical protein
MYRRKNEREPIVMTLSRIVLGSLHLLISFSIKLCEEREEIIFFLVKVGK